MHLSYMAFYFTNVHISNFSENIVMGLPASVGVPAPKYRLFLALLVPNL